MLHTSSDAVAYMRSSSLHVESLHITQAIGACGAQIDDKVCITASGVTAKMEPDREDVQVSLVSEHIACTCLSLTELNAMATPTAQYCRLTKRVNCNPA